MSGPPGGSRRPGERRLDGRLVALGVTGSIAAYKAVELVRAFRAEGAEVVVMLTPSATRFVAPLTLAALSGHPVLGDVLALGGDGRIGHIVLGDTADVVVVAPATAHWLGAMANGLAADEVTAVCLATSAPVVVAPAMDGDMYRHPATQANVARLRDGFGYAIVEPAIGPLASGQVGVGRLAELPTIVDAAVAAVADRPVRAPDPAARPARLEGGPREGDLEGRHVVVSAGGTAEPIDPVRVIANRSTGKMGVAIAEAALDRGAAVTLVVGSVSVPLPAGARVVHAETTALMRDAVVTATLGEGTTPPADALVMAAAVADFRPEITAETKIKKDDGPPALRLVATPDILGELGSSERRPVLVGFAAETQDVERQGREKLRRKQVDLLIANEVGREGTGFGSDTDRAAIIASDGEDEPLRVWTKAELAAEICDRLAKLLTR
jgi:phosphopantothenoylcysteine decarboxylase/phosphopantothenate--cysteine ligase